MIPSKDLTKPKALAEWTYLFLKEKILNLELKPGEQIPIEDFSAKLEVSRTPVREAFLRLASEGLVEIRPRVGYFVVKISEEDIRELFEIRELIEKYAASKAAAALTDHELENMKALLNKCDQAVKRGDFHTFVPAEIEFHNYLQKHLQNKRLSVILDSLNDLTYRVRVLSLKSIENITQTLIEHRKVLESLRDRDKDLAEKRMSEHMKNVCERIVVLVKMNGE